LSTPPTRRDRKRGRGVGSSIIIISIEGLYDNNNKIKKMVISLTN
jgi:hypothetical protein